MSTKPGGPWCFARQPMWQASQFGFEFYNSRWILVHFDNAGDLPIDNLLCLLLLIFIRQLAMTLLQPKHPRSKIINTPQFQFYLLKNQYTRISLGKVLNNSRLVGYRSESSSSHCYANLKVCDLLLSLSRETEQHHPNFGNWTKSTSSRS